MIHFSCLRFIDTFVRQAMPQTSKPSHYSLLIALLVFYLRAQLRTPTNPGTHRLIPHLSPWN